MRASERREIAKTSRRHAQLVVGNRELRRAGGRAGRERRAVRSSGRHRQGRNVACKELQVVVAFSNDVIARGLAQRNLHFAPVADFDSDTLGLSLIHI